jgi:hypothetical protein
MAVHKVDGVDGTNHFPKKFVNLHCTTAAITKGDWVCIDVTSTTNGRGASCKKTGTSIDATAFGVACETTTVASVIRVQTAGLCDFALLTTGVSVSEPLICDATAGAASLFDEGDAGAPVGVYISSDGTSDGVATATNRVMIIDQGYF